MVLKLMGNADSWEENGSIEHTLLFTATLPNDSYKKSFGRLIQRTTHRTLQLWRNFYSELLPTQMRKVPSITSSTSHYSYAILSTVVN